MSSLHQHNFLEGQIMKLSKFFKFLGLTTVLAASSAVFLATQTRKALAGTGTINVPDVKVIQYIDDPSFNVGNCTNELKMPVRD